VQRRAPAILLLVGFLALGSGLLEDLHLRTHLLEHAAAASDPAQPDQSEDHCELCVHLHLPALSAGWVPVLVCLGLIVAFLTLLTPALIPQRVAIRLACRGPPAL
jgi:hypothetical protein